MLDTHPPAAPTSRDEARQATTGADQYTLTIEEAATRYEHAGYPRTLRSIQRYCAKGHLDCLRQETTFGDKFMITPRSVARHIAQIDELTSAAKHDMSRHDAAAVAAPERDDTQTRQVATSPDVSRQDATVPPVSEPPIADRYVQQLERENDFLRGQIAVKDEQIAELGVRARETNILIKGLQELFLALNPGRPRDISEPATPQQNHG